MFQQGLKIYTFLFPTFVGENTNKGIQSDNLKEHQQGLKWETGVSSGK